MSPAGEDGEPRRPATVRGFAGARGVGGTDGRTRVLAGGVGIGAEAHPRVQQQTPSLPERRPRTRSPALIAGEACLACACERAPRGPDQVFSWLGSGEGRACRGGRGDEAQGSPPGVSLRGNCPHGSRSLLRLFLSDGLLKNRAPGS